MTDRKPADAADARPPTEHLDDDAIGSLVRDVAQGWAMPLAARSWTWRDRVAARSTGRSRRWHRRVAAAATTAVAATVILAPAPSG
jgi:hypothetical protein